MKKNLSNICIWSILIVLIVVIGAIMFSIQNYVPVGLVHNIQTSPLAPLHINVEKKSSLTNNLVEKTEKEVYSSTVTIVTGNTRIEIPLLIGETLYETFLKAQTAGKISFSGKNYPGLGFFMTDIDDLHQGNGKYLLYYINGKEASSGISTYIPVDKDVIEWKLE